MRFYLQILSVSISSISVLGTSAATKTQAGTAVDPVSRSNKSRLTAVRAVRAVRRSKKPVSATKVFANRNVVGDLRGGLTPRPVFVVKKNPVWTNTELMPENYADVDLTGFEEFISTKTAEELADMADMESPNFDSLVFFDYPVLVQQHAEMLAFLQEALEAIEETDQVDDAMVVATEEVIVDENLDPIKGAMEEDLLFDFEEENDEVIADITKRMKLEESKISPKSVADHFEFLI